MVEKSKPTAAVERLQSLPKRPVWGKSCYCPPNVPPPPSPLRTSSRAPAAIESHYSIRVQLPRRQHSHTRGINDLVTYKFQ